MLPEKLKRIDETKIEVPADYKPGMRVKGIIYVDEVLEKDLESQSIDQVANVATLPGIVNASMAMPDIHSGYGFAIGGVAAFDLDEGIVSPGGVGYDINCGVRLLRTNLMKNDVTPKLKDLVGILYNEIPSGVGSKGKIRLTPDSERRLMLNGARWAVEEGYGEMSDLERIESGGCIDGADPDLISKKAYDRGRAQQGTLGSGNHFLEIQYVDEIYDEKSANAIGLFEGQVTVMIHTGSRGFGHQVCTDFLEVMERAVSKYKIELPDRELACAPYNSPEAQDYLAAMRAAANYAWANRQCIMHWTREAFISFFSTTPRELGMNLVYDVAHNIAKVEEHIVNGRKKKLVVHRKGATRAFPPGHPDLPDAYKQIGQPVLIPGDMGRASFVLIGTEKAMSETFGSTCHGAGRVMSRHQAIKKAKGRAIWREMEDKGIIVRSAGRETLAEEMSEAYKDVSNVVDVVHKAGISKKVARLRPLGVIKG
ncbi:MAG: RNA-splicing ligase RtcB [Nitrospirae bacterium GWF2_44_13]|nr:MAG: RNA-splicing ligase RtcB [Nitrospirae bacterium GWF2_44_13]OGW65526.1 MAG: RNA-splicing ligase RtcB [Nitrospirae bacterium RIFOXYA2_FULL_44_9]OGW72869.1 MAG: RNA-splicing ligase RtcB [Nitrospirae bacterium RIFOXYC2_FULL_44_7]HBG92515.1 RNA-splicing ligase RtcB [Nitrospiraceae bacterium]